MDRIRRAIALATTALLVIGCSSVRPDSDDSNGPVGKLKASFRGLDGTPTLIPDRNALKIVIPEEPIDEINLDETLWSVVDEQVVGLEIRQALEANGLRIGIIDGSLPPEVEELLDTEADPEVRVIPTVTSLEDGQVMPIMCPDSGTMTEMETIILSRDQKVVGVDYQEPQGAFRVTSKRKDAGIELRIIPEIQHGPNKLRFETIPETDPFEPLQFSQQLGQQQDSFRELATTLTVSPSQVVVIGAQLDRPGSLGNFLLTSRSPELETPVHRVILIWAVPTTATSIPWIEPLQVPGKLRRIDPGEFGL